MNDQYLIQATYPKDTFTKAQPGKYSLLEKLLRMSLPIWLNGKLQEIPSESPGKSFGRGEELFQQKSQIIQQQDKRNLSQMLRGGPSYESLVFPSIKSFIFPF